MHFAAASGKFAHKLLRFRFVLFFLLFSSLVNYIRPDSIVENSGLESNAITNDLKEDVQTASELEQSETKFPIIENKKIAHIYIQGNKHVNNDVILGKIPYKVGFDFDATLSADAIHALYRLGYFRQVEIEAEEASKDSINLFIILDEKPLLEKVEFVSNKVLDSKKLNEALNISNVDTVDAEFLRRSQKIIQNLYREEGYYHAEVEAEFIPSKESSEKVSVKFIIKEGPKSLVTRVFFVDNKFMPSRKLRKILLTQERWIAGFMTDAGKYSVEMLDMDKLRIEQYYRDFGYLMAKVVDTQVSFTPNRQEVHITFRIQEGDEYIVRNIKAPGDEIFLEQDLLPYVLLEKDRPYVHTKLIQSLERLKALWGEKGYVNVDVYPKIEPDQENKAVDVTFYVDKGEQLYVRRINITGNFNTKDKVIRRKLELQEGDLLTSKKLQNSQDKVEALSFFEQGGVNWKVHRITDKVADLELNVKEAKTGHINFQMSYGSDQDSNKRALKAGIVVEQTNFMGEGWGLGGNAQLQLAKRGSQLFNVHFDNPHLFDTNISARAAAYHTKQEFDEWRNVTSVPTVSESGGSLGTGTNLTFIDKELAFTFEVGLDYIKNRKVRATRQTSRAQTEALQQILDNDFKTSTLQWFTFAVIKDTRNHNIYPNKGFKFLFITKLVPPFSNPFYKYFKADLDFSYYTRLIDVDRLVLALRAKLGIVHEIGNSGHIPYKELYNMGGQTTVRGFRFGQIGPSWKNQDPLGARYAIQFNAELIFPLISEYGMKGHLFYDAGAGWHTPLDGVKDRSAITRNEFNIRHAVGFGFNLLRPYPAKIDWGYKLDRDKRKGESTHEFHLSMNAAW